MKPIYETTWWSSWRVYSSAAYQERGYDRSAVERFVLFMLLIPTHLWVFQRDLKKKYLG
jgi:hypothetical protein